jgi:arsenate reductase
MGDRVYNVLFLCTGNSARSILGEALVDRWGRGKFRGFSAGSHPRGEVHPMALRILTQFNMPIGGLRSKSWDEFATAGPGAPVMDFVFTVCDNAAGEVCPVWAGQPITAHWPVPDPAIPRATEAEQWQAFRQAFASLDSRIKIFTSLPIAGLDRPTLKQRLGEIGRLESPADG